MANVSVRQKENGGNELESAACDIEMFIMYTPMGVKPIHCDPLTPRGGLQYFWPFASVNQVKHGRAQ